jgi:hypothetical protein
MPGFPFSVDIDEMLELLINNIIKPTSDCSLMRPTRQEVIGGCMHPISGLDDMAERKMSDSTRNQTSSHYTG